MQQSRPKRLLSQSRWEPDPEWQRGLRCGFPPQGQEGLQDLGSFLNLRNQDLEDLGLGLFFKITKAGL